MRPVRLDLSGFAAFRDPTVVDFTDADYFALTGPTGSGKSTVIDGLTFALYGSAPRWGRENAIQYALAPTANRCTVRLVFDVGGQRYVAAREVRRIGKQIAQRNARLERYADPAATGDPTVDEPTESLAADPKAVRTQVAELLGLDFEDFCTCVVLPQGDFATFLQASVGQRQDILLKLLGARHYDAIGRLAGRRANDAQARIDALTGELAGYADATDDAETASRRREGELETVVATVTTEVSSLADRLGERVAAADTSARTTDELTRLAQVVVPDHVAELHLAVTAAEDAYRSANTTASSAAEEAAAAEAALRSGPTGSWLDETRRWHSELAEATDQTPAVRTTAAAAAQTLTDATAAATDARDVVTAVRARNDEDRAAHQRAAATLAELTSRITLLRQTAAPAGAGDLDAAVGAARDRWQQARRVLEAAETALTEARAAVAGLPDRRVVETTLRTLTSYESTVEQLQARRRDLAAVTEEQATADQASAVTKTAERAAADALDEIRSASAAAEVRTHLQVGHACPVCTQTVSELPPALAAPGLDSARTALSETARRRAEAEAATAEISRRRTTLDGRITAAEERRDDLDQALHTDLPDHPAGPERDPHRDRSVLIDLGRTLDAALDREQAATADRDAARTALQRAEDEGQRQAVAAQQGWAELHATHGRLAGLGAPAVTSESLGGAWSELLTWAATTASTLSADDLARARAAVEAAEIRERSSATSLRAAGEAERVAGEELTAATLADDRATTELATLTARAAERRAWLTGRPTATEVEQLVEEHRRVDERATLSRARAQEAATVRSAAETVRDRRRAEQQDARTTLLRVRDDFTALGAPGLDADDLPRAWAALAGWAAEQTDGHRAVLATAIADLQRLDGELTRHSAALLTLLDEHHVDRPDDALPTEPTSPDALTRWARIPTVVELQLERARAATGAVVQRRAAAARLQTTIAADTETESVSRTLHQLMSAKRFPQWLADAALDTLVADASASLLQLSGGQFELTHERGDFFVIDHADADSSRSVKTLSGGETFQASLALALALSEQLATLAAGGRTTLDSIFLDEGFGTLDPDALEIVAGTLENLAQGSRMVGVVTHVAALADRVPVRFEVSRDSRTSTIERVRS